MYSIDWQRCNFTEIFLEIRGVYLQLITKVTIYINTNYPFWFCQDDSSARLLVLTHGSVAEMWNIDMVLRDHEVGSVLESKNIQNGKLVLSDHGDAIMDASFSPDGTVSVKLIDF